MVRKELRAKTYKIMGELIRSYFMNYPIPGYGTWVSNNFYDKETNEYVTIIHRSASCD